MYCLRTIKHRVSISTGELILLLACFVRFLNRDIFIQVLDYEHIRHNLEPFLLVHLFVVGDFLSVANDTELLCKFLFDALLKPVCLAIIGLFITTFAFDVGV